MRVQHLSEELKQICLYYVLILCSFCLMQSVKNDRLSKLRCNVRRCVGEFHIAVQWLCAVLSSSSTWNPKHRDKITKDNEQFTAILISNLPLT